MMYVMIVVRMPEDAHFESSIRREVTTLSEGYMHVVKTGGS